MKIKEFEIFRYGPLKPKKITLKNFNVLFGKNEIGKTLTIEALMRFFFESKKALKSLRIEENPEGFMILERKNKEIKLPDQRAEIKKLPLDFYKVLFVTNSALEIPDEDNSFYSKLSEHLTGLRISDIQKIIKFLNETGKLTETGEFSNKKEDEKLSDKMKKAEKLLEKTIQLIEEATEKNFDGYEMEIFNLQKEQSKIEKKLQDLEKARKKGKYEIGQASLEKLKSLLEAKKLLEKYNKDDADDWKEAEKRIKEIEKQIEETKNEIEKLKQEQKKLEKEYSESKFEFETLKEKKERIDELKPKEINLREEKSALLEKQEKRNFFSLILKISVPCFLISLIGYLLHPGLIFKLTLGISGIGIFIYLLQEFQLRRAKSKYKRKFENIRFQLIKFGIKAESEEELIREFQKFEDIFKKFEKQIQKLEMEKNIICEKIKEKEEKLKTLHLQIDENEEKIEEIKEKTGEGSYKEYQKLLREKEEIEIQINEMKKVLESHFGTSEIKVIEEELEKLKVDMTEPNLKFDEERWDKLNTEKEEIKEKIKNYAQQRQPFLNELNEIETELKELKKEIDIELPLETLENLKRTKSELEKFILQNNQRREDVLVAKEIFKEIEEKEKSKISQLFGKESSTSKYFSQITDGLYTEVSIDPETGKIFCQKNDHDVLEAKKLSGGAYDQLYFSVRLALAERLFPGGKGFFILDDPFIKSDYERLKTQIDLLKKISSSGWQIIFFTAKKEIQEVLKEDIESGALNFYELD